MKFMNCTEHWGIRLSRLGIGTVQFGLDYGINNPRGRVPYNEILRIFEMAVESGVNLLDTSRLYGKSEESIGMALRELGIADRFIICTKLDISKNYKEKSDREILSEVEKALTQSLKSLGIDSIPIYLLHVPEQRGFRNGLIWNFLQEKQKAGLVKHLGISVVYGPKEALDAIQDPVVEVLQIPFNIFDQRWKRSGFFDELTGMDRDIVVFSRSSYLQGLLVMEEERVPSELSAAKGYKRLLGEIASDLGIDVKELALRYVFTVDSITSTIVGVDSLEQFKENLSIYSQGKLSEDVVGRIESAFADVPTSIVNPVFWKGERERYERKVSREVKDNEGN